MAMNKSTQFVFLRKNERQSGKDIAKRTRISKARIAVTVLSVMSTLALQFELMST